eukprot:COSAG06_NODE_7243_length_2573_cov_15.697251_2_plen_210_part_00
MGSCHLRASAGRGVWVPEGGVCGPRDPSSESPARRLRRTDFADRPTPRFTNCPHSKARCNRKEGQMSKVRLYGNFTEVRSNFSMPLKLIPTVVVIMHTKCPGGRSQRTVCTVQTGHLAAHSGEGCPRTLMGPLQPGKSKSAPGQRRADLPAPRTRPASSNFRLAPRTRGVLPQCAAQGALRRRVEAERGLTGSVAPRRSRLEPRAGTPI